MVGIIHNLYACKHEKLSIRCCCYATKLKSMASEEFFPEGQ